MKNKTLVKRLSKVLVAVAAMLVFSSCNRGYGCPTNFSTDVIDVLKSALLTFF